MHFTEDGDALDLIKDIEAGIAKNVQPADIAPETDQNDIGGMPYNSDEDPEASEDVATPLTESAQLSEKATYADYVLQFLQSTDDGSYAAFQKSPEYQQARRRDGSYLNNGYYYFLVNQLLERGQISEEELPPGTFDDDEKHSKTNVYAGNAATASVDNSIYTRGEGFDDSAPESSVLQDLENEYGDASSVISDDDIFDDMAATVKEIITGVADKRHCCICGDAGIGKTYTAKETAKKYAPSSGKKFCYFSGAMSSSLSSIVPFFYFHRNDEIIMLDDNDAMLMASVDQKVQNMMKAILDPSALEKPVSVPVTMLSMFNKNLKDLQGTKQSESAHIKIDVDALRENRFVCEVNGHVVCNDPIRMEEAQKLSNIIYDKRLRETDEDEHTWHDEIIDEDDDDDDTLDTSGEMPSEFIFNSSVVFISNLRLKEISPAVADRCEMVYINLTLDQYMHRLQTILGGLCNGEKYSSRPQWMRDWAKKSIFTLLQAIIEGFHRDVTLFRNKIIIRRKFTFRMFEEFCGIWCRFATTYAERAGLNLQNENDQCKASKAIMPNMIRRMLDWMKQEERK